MKNLATGHLSPANQSSENNYNCQILRFAQNDKIIKPAGFLCPRSIIFPTPLLYNPPSMKRSLPILLIAFSLLAACTSTPITPQPTVTLIPTTPATHPTATPTIEIPTSTPKVNFESLSDLELGLYLAYWVDTELKVYITSLDGALKKFLIDSPTEYVSISSDNSKIAISSDEELSIFELSTGEKNSIGIESGCDEFRRSSWSPDSKKLVFAARYFDSWRSIIILSLEDMKPITLTFWETIETDPAWSPNGQWIAFGSDQAKRKYEVSYLGATEIYLMNTSCFTNPDTCDENLIQVTDWGIDGSSHYPSWSPDSQKLLFTSNLISEYGDFPVIYIINKDGKNLQQLLPIIPTCQENPSWSPDGKFIAFTAFSETKTDDDVFIYDIEKDKIKNITNSPGIDELFLFWVLIE